jgi:hypothetical protein
MAHILGFQVVSIDGGTELLDLMQWANSFVTTYTPTPPREAADGTFNNVTETIELMFVGVTSPSLQVALTRIERFLAMARERKATGVGARIYLWFRPDQDANNWRSEIVGGSISYTDTALYSFGQAKLEARITITRMPYFEGNESELLLTSKAQPAAAVGGRTIHNRNDTTGGNYIDIAAGRVQGSLPTPAKLILTNTTDTLAEINTVYVGSTGLTNAASALTTPLEGEDADGVTGTFAGPYASGTETLVMSFGGAQTITHQWPLSRQMVSAVNGRSVRFLARLTFLTGGPVYMTASVKLLNGLQIVAPPGDEVKAYVTSALTSQLQDLGSFRFPTTESANATGLRLQVSFRSVATASLTLDYIMPFISSKAGVRQLHVIPQTVPRYYAIVDDAPRGTAYQLTGGFVNGLAVGGLEEYSVAVRGSPVMLYPSDNRLQRIYFLIDDGQEVPATKSLSVQVKYRPRRLTL